VWRFERLAAWWLATRWCTAIRLCGAAVATGAAGAAAAPAGATSAGAGNDGIVFVVVVCAQTGAAITRAAATAVPLKRWFIGLDLSCQPRPKRPHRMVGH
jgi:hypothetical protein